MTDRLAFRSKMRAAAVALLTGYAADAGIRLQIYPARPRSIFPPTAFVDEISEALTAWGPTNFQRVPRVRVLVVHAEFDTKEAVDQGDAFVDGFVAWAAERAHAADPNTLLGITETSDDATYIPDWLPPDKQKLYYATAITLEGLALT